MIKIKPIYSSGIIFLLALAGSFFILSTTRAAEPIYISQVQITGGPKYADNDFIELFNPNNQSANLNGYRLVKRTASATTDTLIKSWDSDTIIPPHHFYLWANSKFTNIAVKPDITTSATLSNNQGIALRLGSSDKGILIDSVAWGTAHNSFNTVAASNPGPGQALVRENLYSAQSLFTIIASLPRSSTMGDGLPSAAPTISQPARSTGIQTTTAVQAAAPASPTVLGEAVAPSAVPSPTASEALATATDSPAPLLPAKGPSKGFSLLGNIKYLFLTVVSLILFVVLLWFVFR